MAYHKSHKIDTKIVRVFNTYGERMRKKDGRAIPAFIDQAMNGKAITIFGKGNQSRSFCYISDLIEGIYRLSLSDMNSPVNIGNPNELSIKGLACFIKKLTSSASRIVYRSLPVDDPKVRQPDISIAKKYLKWEPKVSLEEGLKRTIQWFGEK